MDPTICSRLFLIAGRPELASSKLIRRTVICFAWECIGASLSVQDVPKSRIRPAWNCRNGVRLRVVGTMLVVIDDAARHREIFLAAESRRGNSTPRARVGSASCKGRPRAE